MARDGANVDSNMALLYSRNKLWRDLNLNKLPLPTNVQEIINFGARKLSSSFSPVPALRVVWRHRVEMVACDLLLKGVSLRACLWTYRPGTSSVILTFEVLIPIGDNARCHKKFYWVESSCLQNLKKLPWRSEVETNSSETALVQLWFSSCPKPALLRL